MKLPRWRVSECPPRRTKAVPISAHLRWHYGIQSQRHGPVWDRLTRAFAEIFEEFEQPLNAADGTPDDENSMMVMGRWLAIGHYDLHLNYSGLVPSDATRAFHTPHRQCADAPPHGGR